MPWALGTYCSAASCIPSGHRAGHSATAGHSPTTSQRAISEGILHHQATGVPRLARLLRHFVRGMTGEAHLSSSRGSQRAEAMYFSQSKELLPLEP
mmetsp:Transcript_96020/g.213784  ORF Transcript_96020/g.213784 Transcript_96020/m.213784 type:complete len:96 (+) Transcript_96020:1402-1689(+)